MDVMKLQKMYGILLRPYRIIEETLNNNCIVDKYEKTYNPIHMSKNTEEYGDLYG